MRAMSFWIRSWAQARPPSLRCVPTGTTSASTPTSPTSPGPGRGSKRRGSASNSRRISPPPSGSSCPPIGTPRQERICLRSPSVKDARPKTSRRSSWKAAEFTNIRADVKFPRLGIELAFMAADHKGDEWAFDVSGAFSASQTGLRRADTLVEDAWQSSGTAPGGPGPPPGAPHHRMHPSPGSAGLAALDALRGPGGSVFDLIELLKPADAERLRTYALKGRPSTTHPPTGQASGKRHPRPARGKPPGAGGRLRRGGLRDGDAAGRTPIGLRRRNRARTRRCRCCVRAGDLTEGVRVPSRLMQSHMSRRRSASYSTSRDRCRPRQNPC